VSSANISFEMGLVDAANLIVLEPAAYSDSIVIIINVLILSRRARTGSEKLHAGFASPKG